MLLRFGSQERAWDASGLYPREEHVDNSVKNLPERYHPHLADLHDHELSIGREQLGGSRITDCPLGAGIELCVGEHD